MPLEKEKNRKGHKPHRKVSAACRVLHKENVSVMFPDSPCRCSWHGKMLVSARKMENNQPFGPERAEAWYSCVFATCRASFMDQVFVEQCVVVKVKVRGLRHPPGKGYAAPTC